MNFTVAHVQTISEVKYDATNRELLVVYTPAHPGNQKRTHQIRFSGNAIQALICATLELEITFQQLL
ncbi:hypothetical protein OSW16_06185 [Pseudomonas putida]|uniref:hypothetical protein n=1 Tax=Pseudomonas putida TaxID=303 RepID=UPI002270DDBB|nr:hypothetical protein [Pseudomonas putida]WAB99238.1 hypothetical protein OSW16_06185 [Pseudomonas putida]